MTDKPLFSGNSLSDVLRAQGDRLRDFVLSIDPDVVLRTAEEDMLDSLVSKFEIDCPVLRTSERYTPGATDTRIDVTGDFRRATFGPGPHYVTGTRYSLHVPFDGEGDVFFLRPSTFSLSPPRAAVRDHELVVTVESPADSLDPAAMAQALERSLADIETHLERARSEISTYNTSLRESARGLLARRREKVLADRVLEAHLAVPVTRRQDRSAVLAVDVGKKRTNVRPLPTTSVPFQPEPAIQRADFDAIVEVISSFASAVERFPDTFSPMAEEVLREVVLVILNNQFGPAVGELFSRKGKTDIAIVQEQGPVFIGECKIWRGEKAFRSAIDQLLGYLVWRDTKAAVVLFVKNKDVTLVATKAHAELRVHDQYKRDGTPSGGQPVFVFHHGGDASREIEVALIIVPIPSESDDAPSAEAGQTPAIGQD